MNHKIVKIMVSLIIILIVSLVFFKFNHYLNKARNHKLDPDLNWIGIIDMGNNNNVSVESTLNGEEVVLIMDHTHKVYHQMRHKIPQLSDLNLEEVFNLTNLHLFDENGDGIFDSKDPHFKHLYALVFTEKGQRSEIKKMSEIGIQGIYVKRLPQPGRYIVLMSDGSKHLLYSTAEFE